MASKSIAKNIEIKNRKASFEYFFIDTFTAGIVLKGTEMKSIRMGKASISEAYCLFMNGELFIRNMNISVYELGTHYNHEPLIDRKLLLNRKELRKLEEKLKDVGLTIIPFRLFISDSGLAKLDIALAKGKKLYDKRDSIKNRDADRIDRGSY